MLDELICVKHLLFCQNYGRTIPGAVGCSFVYQASVDKTPFPSLRSSWFSQRDTQPVPWAVRSLLETDSAQAAPCRDRDYQQQAASMLSQMPVLPLTVLHPFASGKAQDFTFKR